MNLFFTRAGLRCSAAIMAFVLSALTLSACSDPEVKPGLDENNPNLISGEPKITSDPFDYLTEDLTPYVTLGTYRGLTVTRPNATLTDEQFEEEIQALCEYYAEVEQITDRAAVAGDTCNFDFAGFIDGVQFDGGTASGQTITLTGTGGYLEGFVETIIGKNPGESFDIVATFPEDYGKEELNGKKATFKCTLNYIEGEAVVPDFNDEFAQRISDFATADELSADYRTALEENLVQQADNQVYNAVWEQVVENATILSYPEEKVTYIYQQYVTQYTYYGAVYYGVGYEEFLEKQGITDEEVRQSARDQVKEDLIFYAIVAAENIALTDEEYEAGLLEFSDYYGMTGEELVEEYGEANIRDGLLWDKTQDLIVKWANVIEE